MSGQPDYDVGDLVVCVDASACRVTGKPSYFVEGAVYRVASLIPTKDNYGRDVFAVRMTPDNMPAGRGWNADCFRRVDPLPPSLTTLLESAPVRDRVEA